MNRKCQRETKKEAREGSFLQNNQTERLASLFQMKLLNRLSTNSD